MRMRIVTVVALATAVTVGVPVATTEAAPTVSFVSKQVLAHASFNDYLVSADVNGDGNLDVISVIYEGLSVILGDGTGRFGPPIVTTTKAQLVYAAVSGDVDEDDIPDIVVADVLSKSLLVFRGNGLGGFAPPTVAFGIDGSLPDLGIGDLDLDGHLDLLLTQVNSQLDVLSGAGDGSFTNADRVTLSERPRGDLIAANRAKAQQRSDLTRSSVTVFLGAGHGTFGPAAFYAAGRLPSSIAIADFDSNGASDLAVLDSVEGFTVNILLGNGAGAFGALQPFLTGGGSYSYVETPVLVGRLNADRQPDIVVSSEPGYVRVGLNTTRRPGG